MHTLNNRATVQYVRCHVRTASMWMSLKSKFKCISRLQCSLSLLSLSLSLSLFLSLSLSLFLSLPPFLPLSLSLSLPPSRYFALAAAAGLLKYVEFIQDMFVPSSLNIIYRGSEKTTLIGK